MLFPDQQHQSPLHGLVLWTPSPPNTLSLRHTPTQSNQLFISRCTGLRTDWQRPAGRGCHNLEESPLLPWQRTPSEVQLWTERQWRTLLGARWPWPHPPRGARWCAGGTAYCSQVDRPWLGMNLGERVLWTSHTFRWICSVPNRPWGRKLKGLEGSRIWSKHRAPGTPEVQSWGLPRRPPPCPTTLYLPQIRQLQGLLRPTTSSPTPEVAMIGNDIAGPKDRMQVHGHLVGQGKASPHGCW